MIEYITGTIAELNPATVVLETASGVAYLLNITLPTYAELEGKPQARMLVHENIREDAWTLYGFLTERERQLFRALIGVSGVGAGTARVILSAIAAPDLEKVIFQGDSSKLKKVKGIGAKTAERIIVDLRDKIVPLAADADQDACPASVSEAYDEALAALGILGFQKQQSQRALKKVFEADPLAKVETAIKKAMAMM